MAGDLAVPSERQIVLNNIGAIIKCVIPAPTEGGVVELLGLNGMGKSTALETIESMTGRKNALTMRDGTAKGTAEGFGVTLTIGRSTRVSGEAEVSSLEGKLSIADLVDPGLVDPIRADQKRIKALVTLAGVTPDVSQFFDLLGGESAFYDACGTDAAEAGDLVEMAAIVKRKIESKARDLEDRAKIQMTLAEGARAAVGDPGPLAFVDVADLQSDYEATLQEQSTLMERKRAVDLAKASIDTARAGLEKARALVAGDAYPELHQKALAAEEEVKRLQGQVDLFNEDRRKAQEQLLRFEGCIREAENAVSRASSLASAARQTADHRIEKDSLIIKFERQLALTVPESPTDERLQAAAEDVQRARTTIEQAAIARQARTKELEADAKKSAANSLSKEAKVLRDAAKAVDDVLTTAVAATGCSLRVVQGRLVCKTKRSDTTNFSELSHGERWKIALDLGIKQVGKGGLLVIPQECWEGQDPINQSLINAHLRSAGVVAFTARCSKDSEIKAAVFKGE